MTDNIQAFPLQWPLTRPRTSYRIESDFRRQRRPGDITPRKRHTVGECVENIYAELRLMGTSAVVISSNIPLRRDGSPRSGEAQPQDPGVAVYFKYDKQDVCLACDQWTHVEDNLWSIFLTLEAMRGIDRWGAAKLAATFTGYAALPPPAATAPWSDVLRVDRFAPWDAVQGAYRDLAKQNHPDAGGDGEAWHAIQQAYEQAKMERGK